MANNIIDARKRFIWKQLASRLHRCELKLPSSKKLISDLKNMVINPTTEKE